jgi:2-dehydropantoate 2-reductase
MKIAIMGAGAMGSLIGGRLQHSGAEVTFIGRGQHLDAMQTQGLTLDDGTERIHMQVCATDDPAQAGAHDVIVLCTKAYQLQQAAEDMQPMLHDDTMIVPAINGVPWWYFYTHGGVHDSRTLAHLDPDRRLQCLVPASRIIGCVNYMAGHIAHPGVVAYVPEITGRIAIGELDNRITPRLRQLGQHLEAAGFAPRVSDHIRQVVWHKLWGNISFNPVAALTGGTLDQLAQDTSHNSVIIDAMNEAESVASAIGIDLGQPVARRVALAAKMVGHKASMLQDVEAQKPTEIDAIVGAVREIGTWVGVPTPRLDALYALIKLREARYADMSGLGQSGVASARAASRT